MYMYIYIYIHIDILFPGECGINFGDKRYVGEWRQHQNLVIHPGD